MSKDTERVHIRIPGGLKRDAELHADARGLQLSEWIRGAMYAAIERERPFLLARPEHSPSPEDDTAQD